jgi:hypothetical protein
MVYQVQSKECEDMLSELHMDYYFELLKYQDEFRDFKNDYDPREVLRSKAKSNIEDMLRQSMEQPKPVLDRVLIKDLSQQFGSKAPEKLSRLLFMLRENKDVFEVFVNKLPEMVVQGRASELCEPIVHFMFNDLVSAQMQKKLGYISYQLAFADVPQQDRFDEGRMKEQNQKLEHFKAQFYNQLLSTLEAKQCAQSMFMQKFERLDTPYLDQVDVYSIYLAGKEKPEQSTEPMTPTNMLDSDNESEMTTTTTRIINGEGY